MKVSATIIPLASYDGMRERTVSISSAGKSFSVTGWKVGWVCAPAALIRAVQTVKQFTTFTVGGPFQLAGSLRQSFGAFGQAGTKGDGLAG